MKDYVISAAAGLLVGIIYGLMNVRSPAPPVIALVGLLGILVGEQLPPLVKNFWQSEPAALSWLHQVRPHVFGHMPKGGLPIEAQETRSADKSEQG
ncbi:XapX domain-containing protein [Rhizobium sp. PRIMUS64]|jgi:XapX domain-containing protein|uniref:XapX domain-containing protein n=1 Tax=Rhizobium sp. PRIMUS64 TaxID=2908925 RepID=UPI001FF31D1F|nr:XapX domain-containing protein [Rhizobium sp. PRIMUS64]MCJ9691158.1 XapX domain-containing protein [Rhizobium sp. PRIMUS64]